MTDRQIIDLFCARDETAIAEAEKKYGDHCRAAAMRVLGNVCDAEECVNDTWLAAWNTIPAEKPEHLGAFLSRLTRNIASKRLRDSKAEKRGGGEVPLVFEELEECLPSSDGALEPLLAKELAAAVNRFYKQLSSRDRDMFIARYFSARSFSEIAAAFHVTEAHVRMILSRTRKKLTLYLKKEGLI